MSILVKERKSVNGQLKRTHRTFAPFIGSRNYELDSAIVLYIILQSHRMRARIPNLPHAKSSMIAGVPRKEASWSCWTHVWCGNGRGSYLEREKLILLPTKTRHLQYSFLLRLSF